MLGPTRYGFFVFLLSSFCFSFLFSFVGFLCPPLIFARSLLYYVGMPVPLSLDFLCCTWPLLLRKVLKRGWWISCSGALLDRVCLSLERGFAAVYSGPGECSVEVCLVCWPVQVPFLSVDFTCSVCRVTGFLLPFGPMVCSIPL